jgi:hypothetical protein
LFDCFYSLLVWSTGTDFFLSIAGCQLVTPSHDRKASGIGGTLNLVSDFV